MEPTRHRVLSLPLLATYLTWGYNFVALKVIWDYMQAPALALTRWLAMALGMLLVCRMARVPASVPKSDLLIVLLQGFLSLGVYMVLFLEGTTRTGPGEAAIVLATAPLFTALLSAAVGHERLTVPTMAWTLVAFVGVALVILGSGQKLEGKLAGDLLILASAVVWAVATVISKPLVGRHSPFTVLSVSLWGALPVMLPYGLAATLATDWLALPPVAVGHWLFIAFGAGLLGFTGFYIGVRQVGASGTMVYQYLVPPLASLFAWIVLRQALAPLQWAGFVIAFSGVVLSQRARLVSLRAATPA